MDQAFRNIVARPLKLKAGHSIKSYLFKEIRQCVVFLYRSKSKHKNTTSTKEKAIKQKKDNEDVFICSILE